MPGVVDPNVIDILIEQDGGFAAVMVEARRWGDDPDQLVQLGQKFNTYVNFIVDGSFAAQVADSAGKDVKIQLVCGERPTPHVVEFLNIIHSKLSEHDVSLVVQVDESLQIVTDLDRAVVRRFGVNDRIRPIDHRRRPLTALPVNFEDALHMPLSAGSEAEHRGTLRDAVLLAVP